MTLPFRFPRLQLQLNPIDPFGRFNCTAYSAAMAADADSRGAFVPTGRDVRYQSDEPSPDPDSPGLNLQQVDVALFKMSGGRVNLDVHPTGSPWSVVPDALRAGKWAILSVHRGVQVNAGLGFSSTFRGGHAELAGYDQNKHLPGYFDPLVGHFIYCSWAILESACKAFMVTNGPGYGAYYALTRDVYDVPTTNIKYSAIFSPGRFFDYHVSNGAITGRTVHAAFSTQTSAPCSPPALYDWGVNDRKLVRITKGPLLGHYVEPGSTSVRLRSTAA